MANMQEKPRLDFRNSQSGYHEE